MRLNDIVPFRTQAADSVEDVAIDNSVLDQTEALSRNDTRQISTIRPEVFGLKDFRKYSTFSGIFQGARGRAKAEFQSPDFDRDTIIKAINTDSYVKSAFSKYKELFWKEGWEIVGENPEAIKYLNKRIDLIEIATNRSFLDLLMDIIDQCIIFSNCFVVKVRNNEAASLFGITSAESDTRGVVVGYFIIPIETVQFKVDDYNRPQKYKQSLENVSLHSGKVRRTEPTWDREDVIHFFLDRRPGRICGTPFVQPVLDDIVALRQMEEDIQNLVHREIFPIYVYTVGTEQQPADDAEITAATRTMESLRSEGGITVPYRHSLSVLGAEGESLDVSGYLDHFKERVAIGLGLAPHHLGMMSNSSNRSLTERLDVALYDRIKNLQKQISEMIRLFIFDDLLKEGGFDPTVSPSEDSISDRCYFKFKEIDVDTQVKKENHYLQKWLNGATTWPELRKELNLPSDAEIEDTQPYLMARLQGEQAMELQKLSNQQSNANSNSSGGGSKVTRNRTQTDTSPKTSSVDNRSRPRNQFGRKLSPGILRKDDTPLITENNTDVLEMFDKVRELFENDEQQYVMNEVDENLFWVDDEKENDETTN